MSKLRYMKPRSIETAEVIRDYFNYNRGVGHTKAMMEGASRVPGTLIILGELRHADMLGLRRMDVQFNSIDSPRLADFLKGRRNPLVIDNYALGKLLQEILIDYDKLIDANLELKLQMSREKNA